MNRSTFNRRTHYCYAIAFLLIVALSFSNCDRNSIDPEEPGESTLSFQMRGVGLEQFVPNTDIYMFDAHHLFVEKKLNVSREGNKLYTNVAVGTWNIVLLTCDRDISENISVPIPTSLMAEAPMWQTPITPDGKFLSQAPAELRYGSLPDVVIKKEEETHENTLLYRNVAKLQVILKSYDGFEKITETNKAMAYAELLGVPTTLAWNGKLHPDKNSPTISDKPMRENFTFDDKGVADTLNFIVPAHRGSDAFILEKGILVRNPASTDTTTHKLKLRVSMPLGNQPYFGRSADGIEIPYVPKVNSIIQVNVTFYGKTSLDIKIGVKPWEDWIIQEETFN